jgi:hypothetical protein
MKDIQLIFDPKTARTIFSQTEKKQKSQPTDKHHRDNITLNKRKGCLPQTKLEALASNRAQERYT